jgi:hypothetical protein
MRLNRAAQNPAQKMQKSTRKMQRSRCMQWLARHRNHHSKSLHRCGLPPRVASECEPVQIQKAERAGFEPAVGFDPHAALAKRCFRPLSHLSGNSPANSIGRVPIVARFAGHGFYCYGNDGRHKPVDGRLWCSRNASDSANGLLEFVRTPGDWPLEGSHRNLAIRRISSLLKG